MKPANPKHPLTLTQRRRLNHIARPTARIFLRAVALTATMVLLAGSFYLTSSATSLNAESFDSSSLLGTNAKLTSEISSLFSPISPISVLANRFAPTPVLPQLSPTVATYAGDCSTPKTVFNVQDTDKTVCAKVENAVAGWQVIWSNADFVAVQTNTLTSASQDFTFTLTTSSNLGDWRVIIFEPLGGTVRALTSFTVIDAANPVADLLIDKAGLTGEASAGFQVVFAIQASNNGPSSASDVQITDPVPANATFVSFAQVSGPIFSCTSPMAGETGSTNCSIAALSKGETAVFLATYLVDSGVAVGTEILNTADISSNTPDRVIPTVDNNTSSASVKVISTAPCVLTCPSNVTQSVDTGQAGAIVNYSAPGSSGDCGQPTTGEGGETILPVSCNPASGTFFGVGTTTVICAGQTGGLCTFQVTVDNPGALSISLNGADPIAIECGADFEDPGATAVDGVGDPVAVTVSGTVDVHTPGTYTLTYTATEGQNSVSTTRTVNVSDNEAPAITVEGSNPLTLSCGQTFVDPGVAANDACEGVKPVNTSGTVDSNTPGTYSITYTASDSLNHIATATRTVIVEAGGGTVPPTITLNGNPQVTIECGSPFTDPGANASVSCGGSVPVTVSGSVDHQTPGIYTLTYTACVEDSPGHCDPALTSQVERTVTVEDTAAPTITLNGANPLSIEVHTSFSDPGATAHDACAGDFAASATGSVDIHTVGQYNITYSATDPSGNTATPVTRIVNVLAYTFTGFFSPVDNPPILNVVNAGRAVPVKFSLNGNKGLDIFAAGSPYTVGLDCGSGATESDVEETLTAGSSSLTYDATSDRYIYVWKTESSWAGTCRQLVIILNDGSTHVANFKFK